MPTLLIATTNPGKMKEIQGILDQIPLALLSLSDLPAIVEPEETGSTFAENALLKAHEAVRYTGLPAVADDVGDVARRAELFAALERGSRISRTVDREPDQGGVGRDL